MPDEVLHAPIAGFRKKTAAKAANPASRLFAAQEPRCSHDLVIGALEGRQCGSPTGYGYHHQMARGFVPANTARA